jgi:hypothetical protein
MDNLRWLDKAWQDAPDEPPEGFERRKAPDGEYRFICKEAKLIDSKKGDRLFIWSFEVAEGPEKGGEGVIITNLSKIMQEIQQKEFEPAMRKLGILKGALKKVGAAIKSPDDLGPIAPSLVGRRVDGRLKTNNGFQNLTILKCHNKMELNYSSSKEPPANDPPPPGDDDVPF